MRYNSLKAKKIAQSKYCPKFEEDSFEEDNLLVEYSDLLDSFFQQLMEYDAETQNLILSELIDRIKENRNSEIEELRRSQSELIKRQQQIEKTMLFFE